MRLVISTSSAITRAVFQWIVLNAVNQILI